MPDRNTYQSLNKSMAKSDEAKAREHRLAAKLRENLKRRKGQGATPVDDGRAAKVPCGLPKDDKP
jgi:hypothetical protein